MKLSQTAKGKVHIELYNEQDETIQTIDTHNLVVNDANAIVATMMQDASKTILATETLTRVLTASAPVNNRYMLQLAHRPFSHETATLNNVTTLSITVAGTYPLVKLRSVKKNNVELKIGIDVWISNQKTREITFAVQPNTSVVIDYTEERASQYRLEPFTETVTVNDQTYTRGEIPSDSLKLYVIDYEEGRIYFETAKSLIDVTYRYRIPYGLNFMGVGGKPDFHTSGTVQYGHQDKYRIAMPGEFANSRSPILKPATRTDYKPEFQLFDITRINETTRLLAINDAPVIGLISVNAIPVASNVPVPLIFDAASKGLIQTENADVWIENPNAGLLRFASDLDLTLYAALQIEYMVNAGITVSFVADFPKGVPGPQITATTEEYPIESGKLTYPLVHTITKDNSDNLIISVKLRLADNTISTVAQNMYTIDPLNPIAVELNPLLQTTILDTLIIEYAYIKTTHDIYQIAIFSNQENDADNKMFNISGIGPITKDPNTGMRVNWSITF